MVQCAFTGYGPDNELEPLPRYEWVEPDWLVIPQTNKPVFTLNGTAGRSHDLLTGMEHYGGERVLMVAIPASNGTVIAFRTRNLTNYRYPEGAPDAGSYGSL